MRFILKHDVTLAHCWPNQGGLPWPGTFPKGTPVQRVDNGYAIRDESTVARITGNTHDAHHRYVWVQESDIE